MRLPGAQDQAPHLLRTHPLSSLCPPRSLHPPTRRPLQTLWALAACPQTRRNPGSATELPCVCCFLFAHLKSPGPWLLHLGPIPLNLGRFVCVCVAAGTRALCIPFPPSLQRSCCRLDHHQTRPAPSAVPVPRSQIRMWVSCGRGHGYPFALRPLSDPTQRPEFPGGPLPPSPKLSSALCLNAARTRSGPPALDPVSAPPIAFTPRFGCARHATLRTGRVSPLAPNPGLTAPRCAFLSPEPGSLHRRPSSPGLWSPPCNARPQSSARPCLPLYFGEVLLAVP